MSGDFHPRAEVPALLATISELYPEFRDVYEGNATVRRDLARDARALCAAAERLHLVVIALTATSLIGAA